MSTFHPGRNVLRPAGLRGANRALVLQHLSRAQPLSRAEVARRTGISEGTVSRLVAELIEEKLVVEAGAESTTGGRPGTRLMLDSEYIRTIGVEIQNWEVRVSLGRLDGRLLEHVSIRTPADPEEALEKSAEECLRLLRDLSPERLEGIGVSVRGIVDNEAGVVRIGNTKAWTGVPVRDLLQDRLGLPVYVENNVRAATVAEYSAGIPDIQEGQCLVLICIDEGVGAGIILDGKLYRGRHLASGEVGEMLIAGPDDKDAPAAGAFLESLCANPAISKRYAELAENSRRSRSGETRGRVRTICHSAMHGEPAARQAIAECCRYLGVGLSNLAATLDPDMIIIDGAITDAWPLVLESIQGAVANLGVTNLDRVTIRPGVLGGDAALVGAVLLPLHSLFVNGTRGPAHVAGGADAGATAPAARTEHQAQ